MQTIRLHTIGLPETRTRERTRQGERKRRLRWIIAALGVVASVPADADDCAVFLLRQESGGLIVERATVAAGATAVWIAGDASGVVDVILPVGAGGSGSDARAGAVHVVRCTGEAIERRIRRDGHETAFPPRDLDDLRGYDVRISVAPLIARGRIGAEGAEGKEGSEGWFVVDTGPRRASSPGPCCPPARRSKRTRRDATPAPRQPPRQAARAGPARRRRGATGGSISCSSACRRRSAPSS